jgi:epoxyqueuosine reductase
MKMNSRAPLRSGAFFFLKASWETANCGTIGPMRMLGQRSSDTAWIEALARAEGFDLCGVVRPENFPELSRMPEWLDRGYAGEMKYLTDPRRSHPQSVLEGIRSVIVCALNYNTAKPYSTAAAAQAGTDDPRGWISRYAWGHDYHELLREKLESIVAAMRWRYEEQFEARVYADTGPVPERILAKYAGLGWTGKNTLLLNQELGSFFFLGVILTTLELAPTLAEGEAPPPDLCGSCRRCIDACPSQALVEPYVMDARRCIAYLTIELRGNIPEELREPMGWQVFGCDVCQDVCPWNRKAPVTQMAEFQARTFSADDGSPDTMADVPDNERAQEKALFLPRLEWLAGMSEEEYRQIFRGSPIKRAKWRGLARNACIALGNSSIRKGTTEHARIAGLLGRLSASPEPVIAESARWALSRIE